MAQFWANQMVCLFIYLLCRFFFLNIRMFHSTCSWNIKFQAVHCTVCFFLLWLFHSMCGMVSHNFVAYNIESWFLLLHSSAIIHINCPIQIDICIIDMMRMMMVKKLIWKWWKIAILKAIQKKVNKSKLMKDEKKPRRPNHSKRIVTQ